MEEIHFPHIPSTGTSFAPTTDEDAKFSLVFDQKPETDPRVFAYEARRLVNIIKGRVCASFWHEIVEQTVKSTKRS